jgi:hypothetical protein
MALRRYARPSGQKDYGERMELNISKCSYEGEWFDFGNGRLKIRPYPASKQQFAIRDGAVVFGGEQGFDKFRYCLTAWENYVTPGDQKPIDLTDDVKRKIFDFRLGAVTIDDKTVTISDFVLQKADELFSRAVDAEKN